MTELKNASLKSKTSFKLPKGASITKKEVSIRVEEIENGYIIEKSYDISYIVDGDKNYECFTKKWFAKENPLDFEDSENEQELGLADLLD